MPLTGQPSTATFADSKCVSRRRRRKAVGARCEPCNDCLPSRNRVSPKEAFEGPEPYDGKLSRPVLRGPAPSNGGWLLGEAIFPQANPSIRQSGSPFQPNASSTRFRSPNTSMSEAWRLLLFRCSRRGGEVHAMAVETVAMHACFPSKGTALLNRRAKQAASAYL
jgi:hypothetical protein